MMDQPLSETLLAWAFILGFYVLPLLHVILSPRGGAWRVGPDTRCPFAPRIGWLVIVLVLGIIGWFLFMRATAKRGLEESGGGPA
ncbi:DUF2897 family protein [Limibacillus halophilus]|uniref:Phospholipase_D-nuclease N-terminal n=1 Tax=Limibacillus halophilus TaxID=1579333 RepID=A0A839SWG9_9PROT|nr:DUF2897 family protein [Limibacillus halophilus]MBB3065303.1 hypothetical protein [Limibacillus halophilus]